MNREILKLILPTTARKPASIQEHKSYFCSLWDDSDEIDIVRSIGTVISRLAKQGNALDLGGFRLLTRIGEEKKLDKKGRSRGTTKRWIARWEEV